MALSGSASWVARQSYMPLKRVSDAFILVMGFVIESAALIVRFIGSIGLVRRRMSDFRQALFDSIMITNMVESVNEQPIVSLAISKLTAIIGEDRVSAIRGATDINCRRNGILLEPFLNWLIAYIFEPVTNAVPLQTVM